MGFPKCLGSKGLIFGFFRTSVHYCGLAYCRNFVALFGLISVFSFSDGHYMISQTFKLSMDQTNVHYAKIYYTSGLPNCLRYGSTIGREI